MRYDLAHSHILSIVRRTATRVAFFTKVELNRFQPVPADAGVEEVYFRIVGEPQPEGWNAQS